MKSARVEHRGYRVKSILLGGLLVVTVFLVANQSAFCQLPTATIAGTVRDGSGAGVPDAMVTAKNSETGQTRNTVSAADGSYRLPDLPVGTYEVKAEHSGFEVQLQSNLTLTVSQEALVNFSLQVGSTQQTVTVTAEAPIVNVTNATLGGLVNDEKIADLPLNGRNYIDLTLLQPGVVRNTNMQSTASGAGGTWFSSNGAPLRSNTYLLDGSSFVNFFGGVAGSISGTTLGVEGIREYRVLTNSFGAEYGMTMGSQTVMVTKGGTNQLHGDIFEYLRNSALDAANFFDSPASSGGRRLPEYRRNNFGGAVGGPIKKDKMFVFGAYEGLRQTTGATVVSNVLAAGCHGAAGATITNTACPQLQNVTSVKISAVTAPLVAVFPNPNLPNNRFTFPLVLPDSENYGQVRVDFNLSPTDTIFGRYTIINSEITGSVAYPFNSNPSSSRQQNFAFGEQHIFSGTLLNSFRITFNRSPRVNIQTNVYSGPGYTFIPGTSLPMGAISVSGVTGTLGSNPSKTAVNFYSLGDDIFWTRGKHSLKMGTLMNMMRMNVQLGNALWGSVSFPSIASFLQGQPQTIAGLTPGALNTRHWLLYTYGFYIQDDFRVTSNFTLNLGLRYEFTTQPTEDNGYSSAIRNIATDSAVTIGNPFQRPTPDNFSPRFGFAWDVRGNGKTSVRGGAAILYDMLTNLGNDYNSLATGTPPFSSQFSVSNPTNFTIPFTIPATASSTALRLFNYHFNQPKLLSYSLTVERQLPFNIAATLSYTGTNGADLVQNIEGNPTVPQGIPQNGACVARPAGQAVNLTSELDGSATACWFTSNPRLNPNFGTIQYFSAEGNSSYNSLQFQVVKRLTHGFQFQSAYTWSHLIDDRNGTAGIDAGTNGGYGVSPLTPRMDRGNGDYDQRHVYHFNAIWNLPKFRDDNGLVAKAVNGWWMSGILSVLSGVPINPTLGSNRSRSLNGGGGGGLDRPDIVSGRTAQNITQGVSTGNGIDPCPTAGQQLGTPTLFFDPCAFTIPAAGFLGTAGRNSISGPGYTDLDFSLVKDTHITSREATLLQFRAEVFNVLNHPNFSLPSASVYSATANVETPLTTAGTISTTNGTSRQIQFALKFVF